MSDSMADDSNFVRALDELLRWHEASRLPISRAQTCGAVIVFATGEHAACLSKWYESHGKTVGRRLLRTGTRGRR